jgi:hypothetical protein
LKLKSFDDLHKLWYVLQIERNRLETIRRFCRTKHILMPNPGRLDKVRTRPIALVYAQHLALTSCRCMSVWLCAVARSASRWRV